MQLHELKPIHKLKAKKRVGRGGKRGTYSGRGIKGQKSRSGSKRKPGFEGGKTPLWRQLPKKKGFKSIHLKPTIVNLDVLEKNFSDGDLVIPRRLLKKGLIDNIKNHCCPIKTHGLFDNSDTLVGAVSNRDYRDVSNSGLKD